MAKEVTGVEPLTVDLAIGGHPEFLERLGTREVTPVVGVGGRQYAPPLRLLAEIRPERRPGEAVLIRAQVSISCRVSAPRFGSVARFQRGSAGWVR